MGCSCGKPKINMDFSEFNKKYDEDISNDKKVYKFNNKRDEGIGDEGLKIFCAFDLKILERLYLSYNAISNIDCFEDMELPKLIVLDLSHNKIKNINIFAKVKYPLERLDLCFNEINNIDIFKEEETLPKLNSLFLSNNDINFDDEKIKKILEKFNERIKKNKGKDMEYKNDESYSDILKRLKTLNDKIKSNIGIYDKKAISRLKTLKDSNGINNEELNKIIDGISLLSSSEQKDENNNID
jgi:hypothetical protein